MVGVGIAFTAMLILSFFVVLFVILYQRRQIQAQREFWDMEQSYSRKLLDTAINTEEKERKRIAQDLHDDIGTMLSLTKFNLNQIPHSPSDSESALAQARTLLEETILSVRRITSELVPATLDRFGLASAIDEFLDRVGEHETMRLNFICRIPDPVKIAPKTDLIFYRICQEVVNNAIKHSHCDVIEILLFQTESDTVLSIRDNGRGFDYNEKKRADHSGHGIRNIESRASVIDAALKVESAHGKGTLYEISVKR